MQISEKTQKYIDVIKKEMEKIGVMTDADKENLEFLTTQVELYNRALEELEKNGLTCYDKVGRLSVNPAFTIQRSAMVNVLGLMKELSISARQRRMLLKDDMTEEHDPLDDNTFFQYKTFFNFDDFFFLHYISRYHSELLYCRCS